MSDKKIPTINFKEKAMGLPPADFVFVVQDVLEEVRKTQPAFKNLQAPIDKKGAHFFVNQNSREPMNEPDEMVPLWKIFDIVGADWTYSSKAKDGRQRISACSQAMKRRGTRSSKKESTQSTI